METILAPLPLGTSDFSALRKSGQIYVDKTRLIYTLASKRQKFFLSRPRRFGKSLLLSTFESLFKYGLRDFHGLEIILMERRKYLSSHTIGFLESERLFLRRRI